MIKYICRKCSAEFKIPQTDRVKCFACGKLSLMPVSEEETVVVTTSAPEPKKSQERDRFGRRKVNLFVKNKFVDDGTLCVEDKEFTKAVGFTVSQREERLTPVFEKKCEECKSPFQAMNEREYRCGKCSRG